MVTPQKLVRFGDDTDENGNYLEDTLCSDPGETTFDDDGNLVKDSFNELEDMAYHDVSVGYAVTDNLRLTLGVNNLWDTDPEVSYTTFANSFDPSMYEIPGRFFYGRVNLEF